MSTRFESASSEGFTRTTDLLNYNAPYMMTGWFYLVTNTGTFQHFFSISNNDFGAMDYAQADGAGANFQLGVNGTDVGGATSVPTGIWFFLAGRRSSLTLCELFYGNLGLPATLEVTNTTSISGRAAASRMDVGVALSTPSDPLNGRVFGLKYWSRALTLEEIRREQRQVTPVRNSRMFILPRRPDPFLYGWWPCEAGGSGARNKDYGPMGRNWTERGTLSDEENAPIAWGRPEIDDLILHGAEAFVAAPAAGIPAGLRTLALTGAGV